MKQKQLFITTGFCLLLLAAFLSIAGASGQSNTPLRFHYTTDSDLARGTTAIFDYTVEFIDKYGGYIAPETQITLYRVRGTTELIDDGKRLQYTFDTLETRNWQIKMDEKGSSSGTFELVVPEDTCIFVNVMAINGSEFIVAYIGFDRKSNIPGKENYLVKTQDSAPVYRHEKPSIDSLTTEQLQTEYDVVVDLRDRTKAAEATRILGEIPANKELVKHPGVFRMKISLANLIKLAKARIECTSLQPSPWIPTSSPIKDSTEIQTIEDVDSQSVTPPLNTIIIFSSKSSITGRSFY